MLQPLQNANEPPASTFDLPVAMSTGAPGIDALYDFILWFSVAFTVAITGAMLYFVWRYRRRAGVKAAETKDNTLLELSWTVPPLFLCVALFHMSYGEYIKNVTAAENALEIRVRGQRWQWSYQYPDGTPEQGDTLYLPINKPVKLVMSSADVIHSFFVPAFRIKRDAVPGMYSQLAFTPNKLGEAQVFCAEYCGAAEGKDARGHFAMLSRIKIVSDAEYAAHIEEQKKRPATMTSDAEWGAAIYSKKGCNSCHSIDGSAGTGPTFKGVYGREEILTTGEKIKVDSNYIVESIRLPQKKIVKGYEGGNMPAFPVGVLNEDQLNAVISYLQTVK